MRYSDFDHYLETLGFEPGPYVRAGEVLSASASASPKDTLLVLSDALSADARELASKMLQAMQLPSHQVRHLELTEANLEGLDATLRGRTQVCLVLGFELAAALTSNTPSPELRGQPHRHSSWDGVEIWVTHSPQNCIHDASLKRPVWEDLQHVMRLFSAHASRGGAHQ